MNRRHWTVFILCLLGCLLISRFTGNSTRQPSGQQARDEAADRQELKEWDFSKYISAEPVK